MYRLLFLKFRNFHNLNFACLSRKIVKELYDLNCENFAAPEDVRILTYPDIPDYRLENALLGKTGFLSCRLNWVPPPSPPDGSVAPPPPPFGSILGCGGEGGMTQFYEGTDTLVLGKTLHTGTFLIHDFSGLRICVFFGTNPITNRTKTSWSPVSNKWIPIRETEKCFSFRI